jgi:xylulokinase
MKDRILTFDIGTTGNKGTLFDASLRRLASTVVPYPVHYPAPDHAEQDPEDFWSSTIRAARDLMERTGTDPASVLAIGLSGHMNGCTPVDAAGAPLHPHILHSDCRSTAEVADIVRLVGPADYYRITGNRPDVHYSLPKILWLRRHRPDVHRRTARYLASKDFVAGRLTGRYDSTDYSDASLTGLLDLRARDWSDDLFSALDLDRGQLPDLHRSHDVLGGLERSAASLLGLREGTPVVAGGGDGACATCGSGAFRTGDAYCYLGSSAWIGVLADAPADDPGERLFHYFDLSGDALVACGTVQNATIAYDWALDALMSSELDACRRAGRNPYDDMDALAESVPAGSRGVLFLPYLLGERTPHWDDRARGAFLGLGLGTRRADMLRSVYEGIAFALRDVLEVHGQCGSAPGALSLIGGGALSPFWTGVLSDAWNRPVHVPPHPREATSLGAAIAAAVGVGVLPDYASAAPAFPPVRERRPDPDAVAALERSYRVFHRLYPDLRDAFREMAALRDVPPAP